MTKKNTNTQAERKADLFVRLFPVKAVQKEMNKLPVPERDAFIFYLSQLAKHQKPDCETDQLISIHKDVYELIINGHPAYRCVYTVEVTGQIVVLHACKKTTNGPDSQIKNTVELRRKALRSELKAEKQKAKKTKKSK
jgi:phage-related protein